MTDESLGEFLHDHLGDWIDPLIFTGLAMELSRHTPAIRTDPGTFLAGTAMLSVLMIWGIVYQPVRRSTDLITDRLGEIQEGAQ